MAISRIRPAMTCWPPLKDGSPSGSGVILEPWQPHLDIDVCTCAEREDSAPIVFERSRDDV
jgi:hypothetical protein